MWKTSRRGQAQLGEQAPGVQAHTQSFRFQEGFPSTQPHSFLGSPPFRLQGERTLLSTSLVSVLLQVPQPDIKPGLCCVLSRSVVSTLCDPTHCSLPGSPVHAIFQAQILEWVAISRL